VSTDLVVRHQSFLPAADEWQRMQEIANVVTNTEFVPKGLRGKPEAVIAALLAGRDIGVAPMQALQHINVIDGKIVYAAELLTAKIRQHGHSLVMQYGDGAVKVTGRRADTGDEHSVVWDRQRAQQAGLTGKSNWRMYERSMLTWRAVTELSRFLFADLTMGLISYTEEELGEDVPPPALPPQSEIAEDDLDTVSKSEPVVEAEATQPVVSGEAPAAEEKPKRKRRSKAEIEAEKEAAEVAALLEKEQAEVPEPDVAQDALPEQQAAEDEFTMAVEAEEEQPEAIKLLADGLARLSNSKDRDVRTVWTERKVLDNAVKSFRREITSLDQLTDEEANRIWEVMRPYVEAEGGNDDA
jgi:hypothetical protein